MGAFLGYTKKAKKVQQSYKNAKVQTDDPQPVISIQGHSARIHGNIISSTIGCKSYKSHHHYQKYKPRVSPFHQIKKLLKSETTIESNIKKLGLIIIAFKKAQRASFIYELFSKLGGTDFALCTYLRKACKVNKLIKESAIHKMVSYMKSISYKNFANIAENRFAAHCEQLNIKNEFFNVHFIFKALNEMKHLDFIRAGFALGFDNQSMYLMKALEVSPDNIQSINLEEMKEVCDIKGWNKKCIKDTFQLLESIRIGINFQSNSH